MKKPSRYFIKTFGCAQNVADSERIATYLEQQRMKPARNIIKADYIVINTCMVRESAENRVYGLINNLSKLKTLNCKLKIVITGCMVGMALSDKSGKMLAKMKKTMPAVDEFLAIDEIGFDYPQLRADKKTALVPISNGCNNFCTYCVVPFARGREISRPYQDIIKECQKLKKQGYENIVLLGQNVNSYGADLVKNSKLKSQMSKPKLKTQSSNLLNTKYNILNTRKQVKPVYVKHLGRYRIPTLFPYLLNDVAKLGFKQVSFMSSNPWDFSDQLIKVIADNKNISRTLHIAVQSGDDQILKKMNRWYSATEFITLINSLKSKIRNLKITTDIIVGFPGETKIAFNNTVKLCKKVGFSWAYISIYSPRPMTPSYRFIKDNIPHQEKRRRWKILDNLINQPHL